MVFDLLSPKIRELVYQRFKEPTLVQKLAIPKVLKGENLLIISETGTGKTESVMLPIFSFLTEGNYREIAVLYVTPLRALNRDLLDRFLWWGNKLSIEISVRHGDTSSYQRRQQAEFPPKILITTLETLQPVLVGKKLRKSIKNVKWVILDEVHEIIDSKRGVQLSMALQRLSSLASFNLIMLSATVGEPKKIIQAFGLGKKMITINAEEKREKEIKVIHPQVTIKDKKISEELLLPKKSTARIRKILELMENSRSSLIFTNTREFAEILGSRLKIFQKDLKLDVHHSSLSKDVRIQTEQKFKKEELKSVVCTSSLQLGIDIGSVDLVIQYQSPRQVIQFLQRIGRSGHGIHKKIRGIIIAGGFDDLFESSVIAKMAIEKKLESFYLHESPLDVLAHQIIGLLLEYGDLPIKKIHEFISSNFFYKKLSFNEFFNLLKFMESLGLIFINKDSIRKRRKAFEFYFSQISTIPSSKRYKVINVVDKKSVGNLDEEFVALNVEVGQSIIIKGEAWKVIEISENKVFVEPTKDIYAAIPSWEGELIPVSFEVSQNVGKLRKRISEMIKEGEEKTKRWLLENFPIDENVASNMIKIIKKQSIVPTDRTILIETHGNLYVVNCCFGTKVNETLSKLLSAILLSKYSSNFNIKSDPYRIMIISPIKINLKEILQEIKPELVEVYINLTIPNSRLFEWKFVQVAKRFGIIREGAELSKSKIRSLIENFSQTPVFKEALKEIKTEKLDIPRTTEIIKKIMKNEIQIIQQNGISILSEIGLKEKIQDISIEEKDETEIIEIFKKRIFDTKILCVCLNCGRWHQTFYVKEIPDKLKCKVCGAKLIAPLTSFDTKTIDLIKKSLRGSLRETEKKRIESIKERAEIFMCYGKRGVIALACRGIGPKTAKRVLSKYFKTEREFFKELLKEEKRYITSKKYWKI